MTVLIGLPLLALAAVLQATLLPRLPLLGGALDVVLLLSLGWTLAGDWIGGILWGFIGGLCLDLLSGGPFGAAMVGMTLMAFFASLTEGRFWRSHVLLPLATISLGTLGYHGVYLILLALSGHSVDWVFSLGRVVLPATLFNTLAMLPMYHALRWLHGLITPEPIAI